MRRMCWEVGKMVTCMLGGAGQDVCGVRVIHSPASVGGAGVGWGVWWEVT